MDFMIETRWFAVQTKPQRENLAAASISKLDLEVLLPKIRQQQLVCGVKRNLTKALFTGYLFAKFSPVLLLDSVRYARGVLRVLGTGSLPTPVDDEIILTIQERVQADGFIQLKPTHFQPGAQVTIEQGPFQGWIGQVEREWDDGKRVMILLDAIQRARLLIENRWLALACDTV